MTGDSLEAIIRANLDDVRRRIASAAHRAGRDPDDVQLVAVTKYAQDEWVAALAELHSRFGESRPQQLVRRAARFPESVQWHLIGQLQRNKVRAVLPKCGLIHSVDSWRLLDRINRIAAELGVRPRVLLEVNVSGEAAKSGFAPEVLRREREQLEDYGATNVVGLMTMAPQGSVDVVRPVFAALRELRDELATGGRSLPELSMGMSGDFEAAIEEGATIVRVGSRLFDGLAGSP